MSADPVGEPMDALLREIEIIRDDSDRISPRITYATLQKWEEYVRQARAQLGTSAPTREDAERLIDNFHRAICISHDDCLLDGGPPREIRFQHTRDALLRSLAAPVSAPRDALRDALEEIAACESHPLGTMIAPQIARRVLDAAPEGSGTPPSAPSSSTGDALKALARVEESFYETGQVLARDADDFETLRAALRPQGEGAAPPASVPQEGEGTPLDVEARVQRFTNLLTEATNRAILAADAYEHEKVEGVLARSEQAKQDVIDEYRAALNRSRAASAPSDAPLERLTEILTYISEGRGPFKLDNHEFAKSVIESAKEHVVEGLGLLAALRTSAPVGGVEPVDWEKREYCAALKAIRDCRDAYPAMAMRKIAEDALRLVERAAPSSETGGTT